MTFNNKLLEVQKEIGAIKKDANNPFFNSKYFDINSLLAQVKPILNKHGLVLTQALTNIYVSDVQETPVLGLRTEILDTESGERLSDQCPLPAVADPQKAGSAITYFRRYALQSLLALEAEDDDANAASGKSTKATTGNLTRVPKKDVVNTDEPPFEDGPINKDKFEI